jgi:hypothetical protein
MAYNTLKALLSNFNMADAKFDRIAEKIGAYPSRSTTVNILTRCKLLLDGRIHMRNIFGKIL